MSFNFLIRGIFIISLTFSSLLASFVLENNDFLPLKSVDKINEMANELKVKTGVSVYLIAKKSINSQKIKDYELEVAKTLSEPYVLLTFAYDEKKIDIISSEELSDKFNKDEILDEYIIPILISKDKVPSKYGAALFNGYAEIIDDLADNYDITLENSIDSSGKILFDVVRYIFWAMMIGFFIAFLYIFKRKD